MDTRSEEILRAVVQEFIRSGEPVSSDWLYEKYDFGIKPASIRLELNALTEDGFLEQPHHAAGRVPSDRGYELYTQGLLNEPGSCRSDFLQLFSEGEWPELSLRLSEEAGGLGIAATSASRLYKGLLETLIDHLDWHSREEVKSVIRDFEELDRRFERLWSGALGSEPQVFIGRKSPITRSDFLSVVASDYDAGGKRVMLCVIGPKRMNYGKTTKLLKGLKEKTKTKAGTKKNKK